MTEIDLFAGKQKANCEIRKGDTFNLVNSLKNDSVALTITSPPYNIGKVYEKKVTLEDVRDTLGIIDEHLAMRFADYLVKKDVSGALDFIKGLQEKGIESKAFLKTLLEYLRKVVFINVAPAIAKEFEAYLTKEDVSIIIKQAQQFKKDDILRLIEEFLRALQDVEKYPVSTMAIEVAVMKTLNKE